MSRSVWIAAGVVATSGAILASLAAQELPQGPGRDAVQSRCLVCHEADLITQQRLSRAGWGRELDKMIRWGAAVSDAEKDPLIDYLFSNFGPRPLAVARK